jgi:hypothetical protein
MMNYQEDRNNSNKNKSGVILSNSSNIHQQILSNLLPSDGQFTVKFNHETSSNIEVKKNPNMLAPRGKIAATSISGEVIEEEDMPANKKKKKKNNKKKAKRDDILRGKALKNNLSTVEEEKEDSFQQKKSDSYEKDEVFQKEKADSFEERKSEMAEKKTDKVYIKKKDKESVKNEVYAEEKSKVSEERKENSSEKSSQTQFVSEKDESESTNLVKFTHFDVIPFTEEESKKAKEMKTPSNFEEYTGNSQEGTISKDKLFVISKMRKSIQDLTKGYMVNLRIIDYLDLVQKYSKAAQKIISETFENCTCNESTIPKDTP